MYKPLPQVANVNKITAFIGHSFIEDDASVISKFLNFFDKIKDLGIGFSWEHAEGAEINILSEKVKEKMKKKNLFIGICTKRDYAISPKYLKKGFFQTTFFKGPEHNFEWKTTEWIIQEIGFALGKEMDLILLVEDGVQRLGGLQGEIEFIAFNRNEPEKAFPKLLEMLRSLIPKGVGIGDTSVAKDIGQKVEEEGASEEEAISSRATTPAKGIGSPLPQESWGNTDYEDAIVKTIISKDKDSEEKLYNSYIQSKFGLEESKRAGFDAFRLYLQQLFFKSDNLEKMKSLQAKYPENYKVNLNLGRIYEIYEEHERASHYFYLSASHANNDDKKLTVLLSAARASSKCGAFVRANNILAEARNLLGTVEEYESRLLLIAADIAKLNNDNENYLALLEGYLDNNLDEHTERFNIAYKYSEEEQNDLALYHYTILSRRKPSETIFNNVGVVYENLKLSYKSVASYKESESLGGTLAMSNLANKLINAGFLDEAGVICDKAVKIKDYDPRVGEKINRIKEVKTKEDEEERKIIGDTKKRREFYIKYAHHFTNTQAPDMTGAWKSPTCEMKLSIKGEAFEAIGTYEKKEIGYLNAFSTKFSQPSPPQIKKINVKYTGTIKGYSIKYTLEENEEGKQISLLSLPDKKTTGLMILSKDVNKIEVCEKEDKDKHKYYSITKE